MMMFTYGLISAMGLLVSAVWVFFICEIWLGWRYTARVLCVFAALIMSAMTISFIGLVLRIQS